MLEKVDRQKLLQKVEQMLNDVKRAPVKNLSRPIQFCEVNQKKYQIQLVMTGDPDEWIPEHQ